MTCVCECHEIVCRNLDQTTLAQAAGGDDDPPLKDDNKYIMYHTIA